jgi:hypothetical protein
MTGTAALRADPIPWLLEEENPSARYWTLRDLLDRRADDPEVQAARAAIPAWPPVAELLARQKPDGYWIQRDYYLPKHDGTFWTLSLLADMGLMAENPQVRRACELMFTFQCGDGSFRRRRRVAGQGLVWTDDAEPCTHARIVRFLIQFGYGDDPRTRAAVDWLLAAPHEEGMWDCRPSRRYGCLRATLDTLRVAVLDNEAATHPAGRRGAEAICALLMEPRMDRYHAGHDWTVLEYPYFGYGIIPALEALARLGYRREQPKVTAALDYLLSRQRPDGTWPLDLKTYRLPFDVGQPGEPNKWLTLDALRVIRLLSNPSAESLTQTT